MAEVLGTALMRLRVAVSMKLRLAILLVFARLLVLDAPATLGHRCLPPNLPFRACPSIIHASRLPPTLRASVSVVRCVLFLACGWRDSQLD